MAEFSPLEGLGQRIWVTGPSGSGKSTLSVALGARLGLPVIHLDRLRFAAGSNWVLREEAEFAAATAAAELGDRWIIDRNYFAGLATRVARASGLVCLSTPRLGNYARYVRRSLFDRDRAGRLEGASERINWKMTRWILIDEPKRRQSKRERLRGVELPRVETNSMAQLKRLYAAWNLER